MRHNLLWLVLPLWACGGREEALPARDPTFSVVEEHTSTRDVTSVELTRHRVWAATRGGLAMHDRDTGRFLGKLTARDGLPGNALTLVQVLDGETLLVGGEMGAALVTGETVRPLQLASRGLYDPVAGLVRDDGKALIVTHQVGLQELDVKRGRAGSSSRNAAGSWRAAAMTSDGWVLGGMDGRVRSSTMSLDLDAPVMALMEAQHHLYAATGESLRVRRDGAWREILDENGRGIAASALALHHSGVLLVGTADGAVVRVDRGIVREVVRAQGARVSSLRADGDRLWMGLEGRGLHLATIDGEVTALRPPSEICDNHVTQMTRHRGILVVGTFDRGACALREDGWMPLAGLGSEIVSGLASDGVELFVTTSNGIVRFGPDLEPRPIGAGDPKMLRWIAEARGTAAAEDGPGRVVVGSVYGVLRMWRLGDGQLRLAFTGHSEGVPHQVSSMAAVDGEVLLGSENDGVTRMGWGANNAAHFQDPDPLPDAWVTSLSSSDGATVWAGTCQHGVAMINDAASRTWAMRDGLPDDRVTSVAAFDRGAWVGTLKGVARVPLDGKGVRAWSVDAGLPDPRTSLVKVDGQSLWVGTEAGLARVSVGR